MKLTKEEMPVWDRVAEWFMSQFQMTGNPTEINADKDAQRSIYELRQGAQKFADDWIRGRRDRSEDY